VDRSAIAYVEEADEQPLRSYATTRELRLVGVVRAPADGSRGRLGEALEMIGAHDASTLLLARLGVAAGGLRELLALVDWLAACGATLLALDVELDTGSRDGARTLAVLRELERCEREPPPARARRGRPGLAALAPELSRRIAGMRERGLSLQAIADALNGEGVPTLRGGERWRPSSVQAALGYRRPRPGPPGAPPIAPPPPTAGGVLARHPAPPIAGGALPPHPAPRGARRERPSAGELAPDRARRSARDAAARAAPREGRRR